MPERTTAYSLRDAIAEVLRGAYKDYELEAACDGFGIPQRDNAWTHNSKRVYVRNRLTGLQLPQTLDIARRILDEHPDASLASMVQGAGLRGVDGEMKNLIFAADGAKPRIVLADAVSNTIDIVEGADRCLVYDRPLPAVGLTWGELVSWWSQTQTNASGTDLRPGQELYMRLARSVTSDAEKVLFRTYCERYGQDSAEAIPALIPQVYLHYDPYTARELETMPGGRACAAADGLSALALGPPSHRHRGGRKTPLHRERLHGPGEALSAPLRSDGRRGPAPPTRRV